MKNRVLEDVLSIAAMVFLAASVVVLIAAKSYQMSSRHHCMSAPCHAGKRVFADDQCFCATEVMK